MLTILAFMFALDSQTLPSPGITPPVGLAPSPDCGGMTTAMSGGRPMRCVTAPLAQITDLARGYASEAGRRGWVQIAADNNMLWLQKPGIEGCDRLTVIVFWDSTRYPEPLSSTPAYLGTITETGLSCEATTPAPTAQ